MSPRLGDWLLLAISKSWICRKAFVQCVAARVLLKRSSDRRRGDRLDVEKDDQQQDPDDGSYGDCYQLSLAFHIGHLLAAQLSIDKNVPRLLLALCRRIFLNQIMS